MEESQNAAAILAALKGADLEKVVAASTYGAFDGERCGDLTVLYKLERQLSAQSIPAAINRGGYYFSNWVGMAGIVQESGVLPSFFPADLPIAMVAPPDLGVEAARRLLSPVSDTGVQHIEGPNRYTVNDVANVFSDLLGSDVLVQQTPRDALEHTFRQYGFSDQAAASYTCMTNRLIDGKIEMAADANKGLINLKKYLSDRLNS